MEIRIYKSSLYAENCCKDIILENHTVLWPEAMYIAVTKLSFALEGVNDDKK